MVKANPKILEAVLAAPGEIGKCLMVGAQDHAWGMALSLGMLEAASAFREEEVAGKCDPGETLDRLERLLGSACAVIYASCGSSGAERAIARLKEVNADVGEMLSSAMREAPGMAQETPLACSSCAYAKPANQKGDDHCIMFRAMPLGVCAKWRGES